MLKSQASFPRRSQATPDFHDQGAQVIDCTGSLRPDIWGSEIRT